MMTVADSIAELGPVCRDQARRAHVLAHPGLNGIESVEYGSTAVEPHVLFVHFLKPLPADAYGLIGTPELVKVHGGSRVVNIGVRTVRQVGDHLEIDVDQNGDFSIYWLSLGWIKTGEGYWQLSINDLDHQFSRAPFSFKAGCPVDIDCRVEEICPPDLPAKPIIDYLAKDYASFRQLLIDLIPQLNQNWRERNPSDIGMTLLELLAYEGDQLSYYQDAVANEAYLDTARQRVSVKRHARLIDYRMHDGRNAWTYLQLETSTAGRIPQHTQVLTRIGTPLRKQANRPLVVIAEADVADDAIEMDPALSDVVVFETAFELHAHPENNRIFVHTWGNLNCCLPRGTTNVHLYTTNAANNDLAIRPVLKAGDCLLIEEVKGPVTGKTADANPTHGQVVRIVETRETHDRTYQNQLNNDSLQIWEQGSEPLPLLQVFWTRIDALTFPACINATPANSNQPPIAHVSLARGNIVLADHGRTVHEEIPLTKACVSVQGNVSLPLTHAPLTLQCQHDQMLAYELDNSSERVVLTTPRTDVAGDARDAMPAVAMRMDTYSGSTIWTAVPDLLDSAPLDRHFVVDVEHGGKATLRFGNGVYGQSPAGVTGYAITYRIGNGTSGNIGAETLSHVVKFEGASDWPEIIRVRNPLAGRDGTDPETIEEVRQYAPTAFHAEQFRAVTEADYVAAARKMPEVAGAVAMFRWTGSWYTVFVAIDPCNPEDLITEPGGRTRLQPRFERLVHDYITRYRLAGYDLAIRAAHYIPLELHLELCVQVNHFRGDVTEAVYTALSSHINRDGSRGFFHPVNFTFGESVYLSRLYTAVQTVPGVDSMTVTRFQRYRELDNGELATGIMPMGPWEIARLDNDPDFLENGVLQITARGGK